MNLINNLQQQLVKVSGGPSYSAEAAVADENETEIYFQLSDLTLLETLASKVIQQEQFSIFNPKTDLNRVAAQIRVRMEMVDQNPPTYTQTLKYYESGGVKPEDTLDITQESFELFKRTATNSMVKVRYEVILPDTSGYGGCVLEVDVFDHIPWIKADLELPIGQVADKAKVGELTKQLFGLTEGVYTITPADKAVNTPDWVFIKENVPLVKEGPFGE